MKWSTSIINSMISHELDDLLPQKSSGILQLGGARMVLLDIQAGFWGIRRQIKALIGTRLTSSVLQQAGANGGASFARSFAPTLNQSGADAFAACLQIYQAAGFGQFEITTLEWPIGKIKIQANQAFEAWMMLQNDQSNLEPCCAYTTGVLVGFVNIISGRTDVVCIEHACQGKGDKFCEFELLPAEAASDHAVVALTPDPGLGRQLNLLEMLFDRMPMGVAVLDRQYRIQRYNPTWKDFSIRYGPPSSPPISPGVYYFDHLPGTESTILPLFNLALNGETVRRNSVRLESEGIVTFWDIVLAPLIEKREVVGILNVAVDATERVEAQQNLEQRVEERTHQLKTLLEVAATANSSLDLDEMLTRTLDLLVGLIGASRAGVSLLDEETGSLKTGILRPERAVSLEEMDKMLLAGKAVIESGEIMYIEPDISKELFEPGVLLPLKIRDRKLGFLGIIGQKEAVFTPAQLTLFKTIADQLGVAIDNARLFEKAEEAAVAAERNRLARDLHDAVTQTLFSASMIADVLPKIWDRNPAEGQRRLEELRQLTRGALSEMRTLLIELRPAALVDTDLGDLIGHQVNAFIARTRIPVEFERNCVQNPPPTVKEMFYRITQEAFNNIAKHADAETVRVNLDCQPESAVMVIQDDGHGFDLDSIKTEGMGLGIMEERTQNVGAELKIHSRIGSGTRLQITWQQTSDKEYEHV